MLLLFQASNSHISEGNEISAAVQSLLQDSALSVTEHLCEFFVESYVETANSKASFLSQIELQ